MEQRITKRICLLLASFLAIGSAVYAESFMLLNTQVYIGLMEDAGGQTYARNLRNLLESKRIRYVDANSQQDNEMYIRAIVQRHTIRKGDTYFVTA